MRPKLLMGYARFAAVRAWRWLDPCYIHREAKNNSNELETNKKQRQKLKITRKATIGLPLKDECLRLGVQGLSHWPSCPGNA